MSVLEWGWHELGLCDSRGSPRKKGNVCGARQFSGSLPYQAVLLAIWPPAPSALDFIYGKIQQGQKVN